MNNALASLGLAADETTARHVLNEVRSSARTLKRPIDANELRQFHADAPVAAD